MADELAAPAAERTDGGGDELGGAGGAGEAAADVTPLLEPSEGIPEVVADAGAYAEALERLAAGSGPVAVDAERASGYRYGQRAYLVQLRRRGAGTVLIDPVACPDLSGLDEVLASDEVVLHAATQDLPCLAEVGVRPRRLFDTELAGRLLGHPRVGLGSMVETVLGLRLEKGHSAADWSTRPLPEDWLRYAALDVEVLIELRDALERQLVESGKLEWALEEFAAVASAPPREPRADPWRRTSGIHRIRDRRGLAVVRALWNERDAVARDRDLSPGRVVPDSAIVAAAQAMPKSPQALAELRPFTGRLARRYLMTWFRALDRARALPESELPVPSTPGDGPPPVNRWAEREPVAARRLEAARGVVTSLAQRHSMPPENLLQPDPVRRLAWSPPRPIDAETVAARLREYHAREWQVGLAAAPLAAALRAAEAG